jgi:putative endopeptidase
MTPRLLAPLAAALVVARAALPIAAQELPPDAELFWEVVAPEADAGAAAKQSTSVDAQRAGPWGFDLSGMDRSVKPGDDFARFAGGEWMKRTQIPPDRARYGAFDALRSACSRNWRATTRRSPPRPRPRRWTG